MRENLQGRLSIDGMAYEWSACYCIVWTILFGMSSPCFYWFCGVFVHKSHKKTTNGQDQEWKCWPYNLIGRFVRFMWTGFFDLIFYGNCFDFFYLFCLKVIEGVVSLRWLTMWRLRTIAYPIRGAPLLNYFIVVLLSCYILIMTWLKNFHLCPKDDTTQSRNDKNWAFLKIPYWRRLDETTRQLSSSTTQFDSLANKQRLCWWTTNTFA